MVKKKTELSQEMKDNIKNYGKQIRTLATFVEMVRTRPGMYIGPIGGRGFLNMIREIAQNAFDEMVKQSPPCDRVLITYDERTHTVIVEDNGRGIPFDDMVRIFTEMHTGSNFEKKKGEYSSGLNGVGAKVTNALSTRFSVRSYIFGKGKELVFVEGINETTEPVDIKNPDKEQGTIVTFTPAYEVMGNIELKGETVLHLFELIVPLLNIGALVNFNWIDAAGNPHSKVLINEDGIITTIINRTSKPLIAPIMVSGDTGEMKADIVFTYDAEDLSGEDIVAFSNYCPTISGTHVDGFLEGLTKFFKDYMNKVYLTKSKTVVNNNDIKAGLKAMIGAAHLEPQFIGQSKDILSNEDMVPYIKELMISHLEKWSKTNPGDLQKLAKHFKDIADIRIRSEEGKVKLTNQYTTSSVSSLPAKYIKPSGKTDLELWIVEGDSAAAPAKNGRCTARQGIFPVKGKIPNALSTKRTKMLSNAEIAGIIEIIGAGYGRSFDIEKCKFDKIVAGTDADPDGSHIQTLILIFMLVYMTPLVTHGRLYKALPPLFGIKNKKGGYMYFTNKKDYVVYAQKQFGKVNQLQRMDESVLTSNQMSGLLYDNIDYVYEVDVIANRYALNPQLLELVMMNLDGGYSAVKKVVEGRYRFMQVSKEKDIMVAKGLIDSKYQTMFINDKLIEDCREIMRYVNDVNGKIMTYLLNGFPTSIYNIMKAFEKSSPSGLIRYKGLGEMDVDQLRVSTIHPDHDRTLIQYTVEDLKKEIEEIKYLQSNKNKIIKDLNLTRHDIIS